MKRGRVLHCIPSMGGGGAERQLAYLSKALVTDGWEIHVALTQGGPNMGLLMETGATVHNLHLRGNHDPRLIVRLCRLIAALQPDLVQCWLRQMEIAGGLAATLMTTPWIFSERCSELAYPPGLKTWLRTFSASFASAIVSNSTAGDRYWETRVRRAVPRYVIQNALPLDRIAATPAAADGEWGIAPGTPLVIFAGRLHESKNPDAVVRAIGRIAPRWHFRALLCGEGPMHSELQRLIRDNGLEQRVALTGYASNLCSLTKRASVFISPTDVEGSPNVVLEAMACGTPLIVSDIVEHREILDDDSALFVAPGDHIALAERIECVLRDPAAASHRAGRALVRAQRHALPAIARQYAGVYGDMLARRVRGSHETAVR